MTKSKTSETHWYPDKRLVITQIKGDINKTDIERWEASIKDTLDQIEENITFKIFVNMYGFTATDVDAHKRFRTIIPLILADYGWRVGYLDLFKEEAQDIKYKNTRGIKCVGAVYVHQDSTKMDLYQSKFSSSREHFYQNHDQAREWIEGLPLANQQFTTQRK